MATSAFAFYRAGAAIMAADLATSPSTDIRVQACGDAHVGNFGWYASPDRDLVFDINDFDETSIAPFDWDLKRFVASLAIAVRAVGGSRADEADAVRIAMRRYRDAMTEYAQLAVLDVWYARINSTDVLASVEKFGARRDAKLLKQQLKDANRRDAAHAVNRLAERGESGAQIVTDLPNVVPVRSVHYPGDAAEAIAAVHETFERYRASTIPSVARLLGRFTILDIAIKVVGVGSVGTRCFIVLLEGNGEEDLQFLQVKEASASVLGPSEFEHQGQRVVVGQRVMQAASDILLGWTTGPAGRHYYVRQLRDKKASADLSTLSPSQIGLYGRLCSVALARGHARGGDPALVSGYMGTSDTMVDALVDFASAYADINDRDYAAFMRAREATTVDPSA